MFWTFVIFLFLKFLPKRIYICSIISSLKRQLIDLPIHQLVNFHCSHKTLTTATLKDLITLPLTDCLNSRNLPLSTQTAPNDGYLRPLCPWIQWVLSFFVWQFQSICHHWMFPTIRNIIFPQHDIFLVCLSNYYHYLPDVSLLLKYWFDLGHPLFSISVLSASNAYLLSWLAIFIYMSKTWWSLCFQPSSPSFFSQHLQVQYLKNLHHFSRRRNLFLHWYILNFLLFKPESLATSLIFPSPSMTRSNKFTYTSVYLLRAYLVPSARDIVSSKICRSLIS